MANVDQTKEDYAQTDAFTKYLSLIDQNMVGEVPIVEEPAEPVPTQQSFIAKLIEFPRKVITFICSIFPKI